MDWSWLRHSSLLHFSVTMYDYQAMCEPPDHRHSAAQALISVSVPPPPGPSFYWDSSSALSFRMSPGPILIQPQTFWLRLFWTLF